MPNVSHYSPVELMPPPLYDTQHLIASLVSVNVGPFCHLITLCLKHHLVVRIQSALPFGSSLIYFQKFVFTGGKKEKNQTFLLPQGIEHISNLVCFPQRGFFNTALNSTWTSTSLHF